MKGGFQFFRIGLLVSIALLVLAGSFTATSAQDKAQPKKDPNAKKKETELKSVYKNWIEQDVAPIITEEELRAFKALKTDEERISS